MYIILNLILNKLLAPLDGDNLELERRELTKEARSTLEAPAKYNGRREAEGSRSDEEVVAAAGGCAASPATAGIRYDDAECGAGDRGRTRATKMTMTGWTCSGARWERACAAGRKGRWRRKQR